ncbi:MAG: helix-turn-helix transcriptional regulator [Lentisphaerae bacterium]|nr:helix-turn-helix transcriptional regulator [Lentisphaerota bacterium]
MSKFPVTSYESKFPEKFKCFSFDMKRPEFRELADSGCSWITSVECPAGWEVVRSGNAEADHLDIFFIASGEFVLETIAGIIRAGAGHVLLIPSWVDRYLTLAEGGKHVYARFNNPERYPKINECSACFSPVVEEVCFYVNMLQNNSSYRQDEVSYAKSLGRLLHIIFQRELHKSVEFDHELIAAFQKKMESRRGSFDVLPIAREMGMSFSTFRNFCLKNFDRSPRAVVEEIRMTRARGLLDFSPLTIDEISGELGYADRFAFSRAFSRCYGIAPAAFRKRHFKK